MPLEKEEGRGELGGGGRGMIEEHEETSEVLGVLVVVPFHVHMYMCQNNSDPTV